MKVRKGFVSNSSSTCYILDLCDPEVQTLVDRIKKEGIPIAYGLSRITAYAIGKDAIKYANDWKKETEDWSDDDSFPEWILEGAEELGEENIVFIRDGDEDEHRIYVPEHLIYSQTDYH